jgi:hypothetical protein
MLLEIAWAVFAAWPELRTSRQSSIVRAELSIECQGAGELLNYVDANCRTKTGQLVKWNQKRTSNPVR